MCQKKKKRLEALLILDRPVSPCRFCYLQREYKELPILKYRAFSKESSRNGVIKKHAVLDKENEGQ